MKKMIAFMMIAFISVMMGCSGMNAGNMKDNRHMEQDSEEDGGGGEGGGGCGC